MRHAHLLGLTRRSHFSAQAEESEVRRRLDWDRKYTIFTPSAKREAESSRAAGRSFICITVKVMGQQLNRHYDMEPPQKGRRQIGPGMNDLTGTI